MSNAEVTQYQEKFKGRKTGFSPKKDKYKPNWEWEK